MADPLFTPEARLMLEKDDVAAMETFCETLHPATVAEALTDSFSVEDVWRFLRPSPIKTQAALLAYFPIFTLASGQPVALRAGWPWIAIGVLLQGGVAEELLWRGYLFRHLRAARGFWRAAALAMIFMVAQHILLLWQLPLPIAVAALLVALLSSFPLAHLFEAGGNTIWAPALLHWVIQGALKVVVVPEAVLLPAQLGWMAASLALPYLAFLVRRSVTPT